MAVPCCPKYERTEPEPLYYVYKRMSGPRNPKSGRVQFDPREPVVIPFSADEAAAQISAYKRAAIRSRKQSGPDLDPSFLPSAQ